MMSLLQVAVPLGIVLGYLMTYLFVKFDFGWENSFRWQSYIVAGCSVLTVFIPDKYFSPYIQKIETPSNIKDKLLNETNQENLIDNSFTEDENSKRKISRFEERKTQSKDGIMIQMIKVTPILLKNKVYLFSALSMSCVFFVITVIQFWGSDYMKNVLLIDENSASISFIIVCITAPTLGVVLGGICTTLMGGYEAKKSILLCTVCALLASLCSIPTIFANEGDLYGYVIPLSFILIFGGMILPCMTGIFLK